MTRVSPLLLETAATSVRRAADMSSPFALPPPCAPTPVPAPSHVSLQTHHIPTRHSCTLARSRSTNPCMEAAGGARQPICMYIPYTRAQMKVICRSNSNEFVLGRSTLGKLAADPDLKVATPAGVERVARPEVGVQEQFGHARQIMRVRQPARSPP